MPAFVSSVENYRELKRATQSALPRIGSSHLSEALASALGFRTHAALIEFFKRSSEFPEFLLLDEPPFKARLVELGNAVGESIKSEFFAALKLPRSILVDTAPPSASKIKYASLRGRAWRNMMVAAINAGLEQRLFSLLPADNRWPGANRDPHIPKQPHVYPFKFGDRIPAIASVHDIGFDELSFHVALWPTKEGESHVPVVDAGFRAGEAYASSWLERREGAWLTTYTKSLYCRKPLLRQVADMHQSPRGFGDRQKMGSMTFG